MTKEVAEPIDYLQKENPRSLYALSTSKFKESLDRIHPSYHEMSDADLEDTLRVPVLAPPDPNNPDKPRKTRYKTIPRTLSLLKFRLHDELGKAIDANKTLRVKNI